MSDEVVLQMSGVHVRYTRRGNVVRAVDGVDLEVGRGEVVALVGESGCGKTSLVRAAIGLEPLAAGSIFVDGAAVGRRASDLRRLRRRVQMVFQDPTGALDPRQTVYEAVAEGLRVQRRPGNEPELVVDALDRAGLRPPARFLRRYPHELSGGQRQRVLIAAAMALSPAVLLADEPVASLDASVRGEILAMMRSYVDESGLAIVAVTHDLGLAWNIADRVAVMYLGRIVEVGPADEVLEAPQHPYTRALLSVVPERRGGEPQVLAGEAPDPADVPSGCRFHPRCPLVASGEAARLGIEARCRGEDPVLTTTAPGRSVACHVSASRPGIGVSVASAGDG
jgi:oligopeptide/dipeptide ABC transporter ATP-binding protein